MQRRSRGNAVGNIPAADSGKRAAHAIPHAADLIRPNPRLTREKFQKARGIFHHQSITQRPHHRHQPIVLRPLLKCLCRLNRHSQGRAVIKIRQQHAIATVRQPPGHIDQRGPDAEGIHVKNDRRSLFAGRRTEEMTGGIAGVGFDGDFSCVHPPIVGRFDNAGRWKKLVTGKGCVGGDYHSPPRRLALVWPRRFLESMRRCLAALEGLVFRRGLGRTRAARTSSMNRSTRRRGWIPASARRRR